MYDVIPEIRVRQSMCVYVRNIPVKCHTDPIWNDEALGLFNDGRPNNKNNRKKKKNKMSSAIVSVPDLKDRLPLYRVQKSLNTRFSFHLV